MHLTYEDKVASIFDPDSGITNPSQQESSCIGHLHIPAHLTQKPLSCLLQRHNLITHDLDSLGQQPLGGIRAFRLNVDCSKKKKLSSKAHLE